MQANIEMNEGLAALKRLLNEFPDGRSHWNEAQNRFQFIDRLLMECLGWEKPYIEVEKTDLSGGRADYLFGKPIRAALEAKREAHAFEIIPTARPTSSRKLRPLVEACAHLKDACAQVIGYCAQHGARLAIVCNGPQMVIFQGQSQGVSPMDGQCFVFNGFDAYVESFSTLWKLLSPEGVFENSAVRVLADLQNPRIPIKASASIPDAKAYRYRTAFQENLRTLATVLLEEVEYNPEIKSVFFQECYVTSLINDEDSLLGKDIISSRYRRSSDDGIVPVNLTPTLDDGFIGIGPGDVSTTTGRPIVVVGDVGVGKTSYFEYIFQHLNDEEKYRTIYIHINLGTEAALTSDVKDYFLKRVPLVLKEEYQINIDSNDFAERLYSPEMDEFEDGVEGQLRYFDKKAYLKARIAYLTKLVEDKSTHVPRALNFIVKAYDRQVMVVLDNADQRTFETQQQAFLVAQELASNRTMIIFVALRPSTFYASKLSGALSGYKNEVLSISPPPAHEVIKKRILFALRVAAGKTAPAALSGVSLNLSNIDLFLKALLNSIRNNREIRTFLSNITGGNIRLVLELINSFCGSPNVESERIVKIQSESGKYRVPLHEFTKHALLGDYAYYNPTSSLVACNVFDVMLADKREHFLSSLIVGFLAAAPGIRKNDGFMPGVAIVTEMMRLGFSEIQIRASLRRLAEHRLIETPHAHFREIEVAENEIVEGFLYRATSVGIYHVRHWIGSFSFLDAMCLDTPVFDEKTREIIVKFASSYDIKDRYEKATHFRDYLEATWHEANFDVNYFDFRTAVHDQNSSFSSVSKVISNKG